MMQVDRIWEFLQRLTPLTRSCLLAELERLEICGVEIPGSADIQAKLRDEFRMDGSTQNRASVPSRLFFTPLEPFLADGAPESGNSGRIARGSLAPIWEWISRDLLPTMARDYTAQIKDLVGVDKQREARQIAATFQTKVVKSLENCLSSPDIVASSRKRLASYTAARSTFDDLTKMMRALRAREALAKFDEALPEKIAQLDNAAVAKLTAMLNTFGKKNADAVEFALTLIARRLATPWELIRLATKAAPSKNASDIAAMPYAITVSMVIDRLEDSRLALRIALKKNRILVAKEILTSIYDTEYALQVRIDQLDQCDWGVRLHELMVSIGNLVEAEVSRFPDEVGHVLGSRRLRSHQSLTGRLTYLAWKGRDAVTTGASFCKKLVGSG
jgi:hypothetical protein